MRENILGTDSIQKLFVHYSLPAIAAMLFLGLNTIIDGLFVGNYIGTDALASVNLAMPFASVAIALSIVIGIGAQSSIGRMLGAGDSEKARDAFRTALILVFFLSMFFAIAAYLYPESIARLLGANERLLESTATYIRYTGIFLPFLTVMLVFDYALKTIAMPLYAMAALVVAVSSHMFFSWYFIAHLSLGIKGAALAMGIGCTVAFIMALLPFCTRHCSLQISKGSFDKKLAAHILYSGSAEGLTEIGTGVTTFLFNITLMRYAGESGVAAFTVISYLSFMGNNILIGLSDGTGAIISYNYGYKKEKRVKKALQLASASACCIGILIFFLLFFGSKEIVSLFLADANPKVLEFAALGAKIYAFAFLVNGINIIVSGFFTAVGHPQNAALISLSKGFIWIGIGIFLLPAIFGIRGIWLTVPLAEGATILLSSVLLYRYFKHTFRLE